MTSALQQFIEKHWYSSPGPLWILYPLACLFWLISFCRKHYFRLTSKPTISVPVVIIGNISVGGTGKTPTLICIANYLRSRGLKPGIVSRGYGRESDDLVYVEDKTSWQACGDEPCLIFQQTACPTVVHKKRRKAVDFLLERHPECNLILADDGLQHYQLPRDYEILLVDGKRLFGNGQIIPVGPLREPLGKIDEVDWILVNNGQPEKLSGFVGGEEKVARKIYPIQLETTGIEPLLHEVDNKEQEISPSLVSLGHCDAALAGIGNPGEFFQYVKNVFPGIATVAARDHYAWTLLDLLPYSGQVVLTTGKDAVKIRQLLNSNLDKDVRVDASRWWQLNVEMQLPEAFLSKLYDELPK